jgi:hypothetical protein
MAKKDFKLIGVAITIGVLAIGALYYMNLEEEPVVSIPAPRRVKRPKVEAPKPTEEAAVVAVETPKETPVIDAPKVPVIPDAVLKEKADKLQAFKNLIKLDVQLPAGMNFTELDLEAGVAAIEGNAPGRKMLIMAAARSASPETIAGFLREQKTNIPMLSKYDFKISGDLQNVTPPKNSGISKITIIPGGVNEGSQVFAAYLERTDKKGSYVFVMEASPSQFTQYEGDFDIMTDSLKTKP